MLVAPGEGSRVIAGAGTDFVTVQPLVAIAKAMAPNRDRMTAIARKTARCLDVLLFFNLKLNPISQDIVPGFIGHILS